MLAAGWGQLERIRECGGVQSQLQQHTIEHEQQQWCAGCPTPAQTRQAKVLKGSFRAVLKGGSSSLSSRALNRRDGRFQ
jgi:hypothetical protein